MDANITRTIERARKVLDQLGRCEVLKTIWSSPAGKKRIAKKLVGMLPSHRTYVEPFAGSAAVLFAKEPSEIEVINDADQEIVQAYRCIKRITKAQIEQLGRMTWVGSPETYKRVRESKPSGDVAKLYRFLYLTHFSYGRLRSNSFSPSSLGVTANTVNRVAQYAPRLKNVEIHGGDYDRVIKQYDGPDTVFFLDPPYVGYDVHVGESKFDEDHFFEVLKSIKGKFLLTYGVRGKLPRLLKNSRFHVKRIRTPRHIRQMRGVEGPKSLTQLVVTNYKPVSKRTNNTPINIEASEATSVDKAVWSRAYINDLPDSAFLYIEPGGEKDENGKTVPRSLRHFPVRNHKGELDLPHLRNAIARIPQSKINGLSAEDLRELQERARKLLTEEISSFSKSIPIIKGVNPEDERYVLGIVLEPEVVDAQGDIYSAEEIRRAAHRFMEDFQGLGLMHRFQVNGQVKILESYLAPVDFEIGETKIRKGTWLLAVRVLSDELWDQVKEGTIGGFSVGGSARRLPEAGDQRPEAEGIEQPNTPVEKALPPASSLEPPAFLNRLLDLLVEEVSLVDHAANKKRFLIVKRSNDMADNTDQGQSQGATDDAGSTPPTSSESHGQESAALDDSASGEDINSQSPETNAAFAVAVDALEGLTEAVEALAGSSNGDAGTNLSELAAQFRGIAERLSPSGKATGAGGNRETTQPPAPEDSNPDSSADPKNKNSAGSEQTSALAQTLSALQNVLQPLKTMVAATAPQPVEKSAGSDALTQQLGLLTTAVSTMASTVKAQQQRLSRIEKSFGLPHSTPAETLGASGPADESWPFDINTPIDRESVDKAVSFHDV